MRKLPLSYVATSVAKAATFCRAEYSSILVSSSVRTSEARRSEQNLQFYISHLKKSLFELAHFKGRRSMKVMSLRC